MAGLLMAAEDIPEAPQPDDRPPQALRGFIPFTPVESDEAAIVVDGFKLLPLSRLDANGRAWELHPKALLGAAFDSNPMQSPNAPEGDAQTRLGLGFELRAVGRNGWSGVADAMLRSQRYASTAGRNTTGGDANLRIANLGEAGQMAVTGTWERSASPVIDLPQQLERARLGTECTLTQEALRGRWRLSLGWNRLDYLESGPGFDKNARDLQRWSAGGSWMQVGALDSLLGVEIAGESVSRPPAATANPYDAIMVNARWRHAFGRRSAIDLRLGANMRIHADNTEGLAANDDRVLYTPCASARYVWAIDERSTVVIGISRALAEGVTAYANASQMTALEASFSWRLLDRLDAVGTLWRAHRVDSAPSGSAKVETLENSYLRGGFDYRLRDGLGLRIWASWQGHDSAIGSDYVRSLLAIELLAAM